MATTSELKELSTVELSARAAALRKELFQDLLKLKTGTLENPAQRLSRRRALARVLTVLSSKSLVS